MDTKKNLVFLAPRFHTNLIPFLQALQGAEFDVTILVAGGKSNENTVGISSAVIPAARWQPFLKAAQRLDIAVYASRFLPNVRWMYRTLKEIRPDFVVCRGLTPFYIIAVLPYILFFSRLVLYTQGPRARPWSAKRWIVNTLLLFLSQRRWYTPVRCLGRMSDEYFEDSRIAYIPFSANVLGAGDRAYGEGGIIRLLVVGKYEPRKNQLLVLRALKHLENQAYRVTFVGERTTSGHQAYFDSLSREAKALGISGRITFLTNVAHEAMSDIYRSHDLLLFMARNEPASVSQLEAMAHGLGVIITPDNGTASYVVDGVNGIHCSAEVSHLAEHLRAILDDPDIVRRWGLNSIALAKEEYSPQLQVSRFRALLERRLWSRASFY